MRLWQALRPLLHLYLGDARLAVEGLVDDDIATAEVIAFLAVAEELVVQAGDHLCADGLRHELKFGVVSGGLLEHFQFLGCYFARLGVAADNLLRRSFDGGLSVFFGGFAVIAGVIGAADKRQCDDEGEDYLFHIFCFMVVKI